MNVTTIESKQSPYKQTRGARSTQSAHADAMDLVKLIAAEDGVHARDASSLVRVDASTARQIPLEALDQRVQPPLEDSLFVSHDVYAVDASPQALITDVRDYIHVFRVREDVREAMARSLVPLALRKFRRGVEDAARALGEAISGPGSDVSVQRSNRGGYQSYADLLDSSDDEEEDATDDGNAKRRSDIEADGRTSKRFDGDIKWAIVNDIAIEARSRVRAKTQRETCTPRDVYGWLNVNAPGDYNRLHAHDDVDRWSGVVYLAVPDLSRTLEVPLDAGSLGIRAPSALLARSDASATPYFVHAPARGDVVVFSGAALHAVAPFPHPIDVPKSELSSFDVRVPDARASRVSVAFNVD